MKIWQEWIGALNKIKFVQNFSPIYSVVFEQGAENCSKLLLAYLTLNMTLEVNEITVGPRNDPEENLGPVSSQSFQPFSKKIVSLFRNSFYIVDYFSLVIIPTMTGTRWWGSDWSSSSWAPGKTPSWASSNPTDSSKSLSWSVGISGMIESSRRIWIMMELD